MNETRPTPETIRAYFEHRRRRALRVCAVGAAVAVIAIVPIAVGYVLAGAVGAVIGIAILSGGLWYLERTQCPRCLSRLSARATSAKLRHPVNFCPYCGASLDAQRP